MTVGYGREVCVFFFCELAHVAWHFVVASSRKERVRIEGELLLGSLKHFSDAFVFQSGFRLRLRPSLRSVSFDGERDVQQASFSETAPHLLGLGAPESSVNWNLSLSCPLRAGEEHREGLGKGPDNAGGKASTSSR